MEAYLKSSLLYKFYSSLLLFYKHSLLFKLILDLGTWFHYSTTRKMVVRYFEKTPTTRYSQTYRVIHSLFRKADKRVENLPKKLLKFLQGSLVFNFLKGLFDEGRKSTKGVAASGLLFFIMGYSLITTYLGYWSKTKFIFLVLCFSCIILVIKSVNYRHYIKNSLIYKLIKFLEE